MKWFGLVRKGTSRRELVQAAQRIAQESRHAVWQRVARRVLTMPAAEARGYIRARAAPLIHRRVDQFALSENKLKPSQTRQLYELVIEAVTGLVETQAGATRPRTEQRQQVA